MDFANVAISTFYGKPLYTNVLFSIVWLHEGEGIFLLTLPHEYVLCHHDGTLDI